MFARRSLVLKAAAALSLAGVGVAASGGGASAATERQEGFRVELPAPGGPYRVGTVEMHLVDQGRPDPWVAGRDRELMVSVWYPARPGGERAAPYLSAASAGYLDKLTTERLGVPAGRVDYAGVRSHARVGAPVLGGARRPVVIYSPGGGNSRQLGTMLVEDLASRGYVVVTVDHTYEASAVEFPGGRVAAQSIPRGGDTVERDRKMIAARVGDVRFVLDRLGDLAAGRNPDAGGRRLPAGLGRALDLTRVGMFGHSAGGFTAGETMLADKRVDAGVNLDGSLAYALSDGVYGDVAQRGLDRPFLLMGAGTARQQPHTHKFAPDWKALWERSTGWRRDVYMAAGEHSSYTDYQSILPQLRDEFGMPDKVISGFVGTVDPDRSVRTQRAYVGGFFDQHLRGRPQSLFDRPSPRHPDVELVP
ncbi:alpha/beta hydrolase family protein [Bailinhaonella thermotolerans]|uniref:Lipase n=1 Tax=Bailinhaonella thermotolerans TaxID=1070861 RepID=A0A3A4A847_9ACTN|nr:lipase [Bailinhaonella thermotolerans]RJL24139.1 lipase [Bailinhaonella thermotolerans]